MSPIAMLFISALFVSICVCQSPNYKVLYSFSGGVDCSGSYSAVVVTNNTSPGSCVNVDCLCSGGQCLRLTCNASTIPADPADAIVSATYLSASSCSGEVMTYSAATSGVCFRGDASLAPISGKFVCVDNTFTSYSYGNADCTGTPTSTIGPIPLPSSSYCITGANTGSSNSIYFVCGGKKCFHKDSQIKYHEKEISFESLSSPKNDVPCAIPHVFKSDGVKISTTCEGALRLTHEHLVMTQHGWKKAGLIEVDDELYSKVHSHEETCKVTKIETETDQEYFGLNCEDSHVLSNGYWVSTFGETHSIPATWMKVMSKIIGVRHASAIGDKIASFASKWSLI